MRHSLGLTIQSRSPTICQPPHSAAHGDKDRCDEKQLRPQAFAPFVGEIVALSLLQNHSNVFWGSLPRIRRIGPRRHSTHPEHGRATARLRRRLWRASRARRNSHRRISYCCSYQEILKLAGRGAVAPATPPPSCVASLDPTFAGGASIGCWPLDLSESFSAGNSCDSS